MFQQRRRIHDTAVACSCRPGQESYGCFSFLCSLTGAEGVAVLYYRHILVEYLLG
eukprot:COSAG02_NODE_8155_length_2688_cov_7.046736_1_plen_55_part_00